MNDIEKMLRDGMSAEDIINEVNKTKTRLDKEAEEEKKAEIERAKKTAKIAATRTKTIKSMLEYIQLLDVKLSDEEKNKLFKTIEEYCKEMEEEIAGITAIKQHKPLSDDERFAAFIESIFS